MNFDTVFLGIQTCDDSFPNIFINLIRIGPCELLLLLFKKLLVN